MGIKIRWATEQDMVAGVAERWVKQYATAINIPAGGDVRYEWTTDCVGNAGDIHTALTTLDPQTATPADVAKIIGNGGWTTVWCDVCGQLVGEWMDVIRDLEYEGEEPQVTTICRTCVTAIRDAH
jgi:hypothetical protein